MILKKEEANFSSLIVEKFSIKTRTKPEWLKIAKLPATKPVTSNNVSWKDILPKEAEAFTAVLETMISSSHPFEHQREALEYLLNPKDEKKDLIINGGTYSGKSLSFTAPGVAKLLTGEIDFMVLFYPSKQLLMDQFEQVKKMVVELEKRMGVRLTTRMYSGDVGKSLTPGKTTQKRDLNDTEKHPPNILLATFDKVWFQQLNGNSSPLHEKIMDCQYLVFDEIHAFDGFAAAIIKMFIQTHKLRNPACQTILSSATIDRVTEFRDAFLPGAKVITSPPVRGEQEFLGTTRGHTIPILVNLWEELAKMPGKTCLIFADSKEDIELLAERLCAALKKKNEFFDENTIAVIHADLPYIQRKKVLDELQKGERNIIRIVISSSVLELGVNISNFQTVMNIGIPITGKDGVVQRMARNRSKPGERRVNVFLFDLANARDKFYWEHKEILRKILETNACNPILFPKRNAKVFAGIIILLVQYGITSFEEIMNFFLQEGKVVHELARQQYVRLVTQMILKKEKGKLLFTSKGEELLLEKKELVPFSIRAIDRGWTIDQLQGVDSNSLNERTREIGKITTRDVLRKGFPGNILTRNKQKYLVVGIDQRMRSVLVKRYLINQGEEIKRLPMNQLSDPSITVGILPKISEGPELLGINFGQLIIERKPKAIVNASPDRMIKIAANGNNTNYFCWQELTEDEVQECSIREKVEGISLSLKTEMLKESKGRSNNQILKLFGKILLIETEAVLGIPASELGQISNNKQLAIVDKGKGKGNAGYLYKHLKEVAVDLRKRLARCSCAEGCKACYGEVIGVLPKGTKDKLVFLAQDLEKIIETNLQEKLEEQLTIQPNYHEGKIVALSDIHLTSEFSFEEEFYEAISSLSKQADIIIINGDLLDKGGTEGVEAVKKLLQKAIKEGFWSKLVLVRSSTIHDAALANFGNIMQQDYAWIETAAGEVLFVHGNKIGIDPKVVAERKAKGATIEAKWGLIDEGRRRLPKITKETHLVIGHLHERFFDEENRVYGLGHWTRKGNEYHQKCLMIINTDDALDTLKLRTFTSDVLSSL
ncbi:MAG: DEAD/DEAH box helicase [Candidatus Heimdallarchaeota archaeon]